MMRKLVLFTFLLSFVGLVHGESRRSELGRVNYILRAIHLQPGKHQVELAFFPKSVSVTETVAYIAFVLLLLIVVGIAFVEYRNRKKE